MNDVAFYCLIRTWLICFLKFSCLQSLYSIMYVSVWISAYCYLKYRFNSQSINYTTQCSIFNFTYTIFFYRNGAYTHPSISVDPYFQFVNIITEGFGLGNEQFISEHLFGNLRGWIWLRPNSHLRFFRRELLRELFSPHNRKKWVHNPLLNFSVHTIVDQIAGVTAPI